MSEVCVLVMQSNSSTTLQSRLASRGYPKDSSKDMTVTLVIVPYMSTASIDTQALCSGKIQLAASKSKYSTKSYFQFFD